MTTQITQAHGVKRFGLTEVYRPIGDEAVDIVFIHGLDGHPYHTWTSEEYKIFWPAQLLPPITEKEKARILVYGYDADVFAFTDDVSVCKDKIHNHAEHLIADLCANRRQRKATERPVIFIAHSLGGLVVKRALIYSSEIRGNHTEHLRSIFVSTYGILFLGTPHGGSDFAKWGYRLEWICAAVLPNELINTQPEAIKTLKIENETLLNIDRQFIQLSNRFRIYFFHEAKPTNLNGTLQYIVDKESASPNIQDVERASIQQDHSHMCKFESDGAPGFSLIAEGIQRYAVNAPKAVSSRWSSERAEQRARKEADAEELLASTLQRSMSVSQPKSTSTVKTLFLVPFDRDIIFVDRVKIFEEINERSKHHRRVSLSGIAGVGKSQIAIEYCYRFHNLYPNAHVIWIYASTRQRLEQAYKNIAKILRLPGWDDPTTDTLLLVSEWFNEPENEKWLMILDNADDLDTFFTAPTTSAVDLKPARPFLHYLPQPSRGSILITTRDKRMSERLAGKHASILIQPMSLPEAQDLLRFQIRELNNWNDDDSATLVKSLEYIPLAITQAAAFISQNSIDIAKYLDLFRTKDSELQDLLDEDLGDLRRDAESQNSITRTWKISFDLINKQKTRAAEILSLMAVLDRQGIPKSLLQNNSDRDIDITTALGTLMAFSLISVEKNGVSYSIHRLVQLATRKWLEIQRTQKKWQKEALIAVANSFPLGDFEFWATCESLLPHAQIVIQYKHAVEVCLDEYSLLLLNMAEFDRLQGRYDSALIRSLTAVETRTKICGLEHPTTLTSMVILAATYRKQGRWDEAEKIQVQVMETSLRALKAEHPDTLTSMANLAATYRKQGRWDEAEKIQVQVMETSLRVLKAEHPDTLTSMANLAQTYWNQGRWDEAEKLEVQVMETSLRVLKAEHPDTLTSMANLAATYRDQGRWDEAEKLQVQVMETRLRVLKAEHPDTLSSMANLAATYRKQGRWDEAEKLQVQVMETRLRVLKAEHPDTLSSMANLAATYRKQGRWDKAEKLQVQVMETRLRVLKAEHPDTLTSMANLAATYRKQGRWDEAEKLQVQVMETRLRVLKAEHPDTLSSMANLAATYRKQGRWDEAEKLQVQVMETRLRVLKAEHPDTLSSMANLAATYRKQGRWDKAEKLQVQVMETRLRVLKAEHPDTLSSMANLAATYRKQGRWDKAENLQVQVMETRSRVLKAEHPDTLTSMGSLAITYQNQGRWDEAEKLEVQVMGTCLRVLKAEHPDTLTSMNNMAYTYYVQDRHNEAIELMKKVVELRTKSIGANHPNTRGSIKTLKKWTGA